MVKRACVDRYTGPVTAGIDVSKWQGDVDWHKVANGSVIVPGSADRMRVRFAFARTGDGKDLDRFFIKNWRQMQDKNIIRGSYHYFRADRDGKFQAELVLKALDDAGGFNVGEDLPPVLDLEDGSRKNLKSGIFEEASTKLPIALVVDECLEYLDIIEQELGVRPLIYTGQTFHWWLSQGNPELAKLFAKYPLWTPSYGGTCPRMPVNLAGNAFPWETWSFWQFTASGKVSGVNGNCDVNIFRGDLNSLFAFITDLSGSDKYDVDEYENTDMTVERLDSLLCQVTEMTQIINHVKTDLSELEITLSDWRDELE